MTKAIAIGNLYKRATEGGFNTTVDLLDETDEKIIKIQMTHLSNRFKLITLTERENLCVIST